MTPRINALAAATPALSQAWFNFSKTVHESGLEKSLIHLIEMRASQINGCAFCLDMHAAEALAGGETQQRLFVLDAWRDSPLYSDRERAALAWTESLTLVAQTHVPDDVYNEVKAHFSPNEQVSLTMVIVSINGWNRLNVGFRTVHPVKEHKAA